MNCRRPGTVTIRILFFAKSRELSGLSETAYQLETTDGNIKAEELLQQICVNFNLQAIKDNIILAINEVYCENLLEQLQLKEGDEIALIPPISGG